MLVTSDPLEPPVVPHDTSDDLPTVATDRPDVTNGTVTAAPGVWKL